jgi:hypothetical protein
VLWRVPIESGSGGPPTVADFDGDGAPEIGVAGGTSYAVYDGDGTVQWSRPTQDISSAITGSSVFDFNGDLAAWRTANGPPAGPQPSNSQESSVRKHPVRVRSPDSAVIRGNRESEGPLECPPGYPRPGEILETVAVSQPRLQPKPSRLPQKAPISANAVDLHQSGLLRGRRSGQGWSGVVRMAHSTPRWRVEGTGHGLMLKRR